jgi:hypothetical protein
MLFTENSTLNPEKVNRVKEGKGYIIEKLILTQPVKKFPALVKSECTLVRFESLMLHSNWAGLIQCTALQPF